MVMSALPLKADMCGALAHVCFGPIADITLSELGAIFAGNFVQLLLASLYWWCPGSRSYFTEKTFQPFRCCTSHAAHTISLSILCPHFLPLPAVGFASHLALYGAGAIVRHDSGLPRRQF